MSFDRYAHGYDADLEKGIALSGESKEFFARGRLEAARAFFERTGFTPRRIIEFGCGIGTNLEVMRRMWPDADLVGLDRSEASLAIARERYASTGIRFITPGAWGRAGDGPVDWVFCNGVFHHISPTNRPEAYRFILGLLRAGGVFTLYENNPFNPGTRLVMRRIPFDRDAQLINPYRAPGTLVGMGFERPSRIFLFVFPRWLGSLRAIEPWLARLPLGAQYGVFVFRAARSE